MSDSPNPMPDIASPHVPKPWVRDDKTAPLVSDDIWGTLGLVILGLSLVCFVLLPVLPIIVMLSLGRTLTRTRRARKLGKPTSRGMVVRLFFISAGITAIIVLGTLLAFIAGGFLTSFAVNFISALVGPIAKSDREITSVVGGIFAGLGMACYLFRTLWPQGDTS